MISRLKCSMPLLATVLALPALARDVQNAIFSGVPAANTKSAGNATPDVLTPELIQVSVAQGSTSLDGGTATFPFYGYDGDGPMFPAPGAVQSVGNNVEASKTEPDKNTYLILQGQVGPDAAYNYGTHFLYQGHELGAKDPITLTSAGYITRINLDADGVHRVTLLAARDAGNNPLPVIDGSTWYPWSGRLLFSSESSTTGGVWQATPDYPSSVIPLAGVFGNGGYEGMQADLSGNILFIEDVGGTKGTVNSHARQPNSFLYRLVPKSIFNLTLGGKLQVLQVMSLANPGLPISFHAGAADADILSQDVHDLHTYGLTFATNWVTIHDTDVDGFTAFGANALAKTLGGTPFKRPENGQYKPGANFREFYFDETGDTDINTEAGSQFGGFGSIMRLSQAHSYDDHGILRLFYLCDAQHSGFDNCAFLDKGRVVFVEDAGDSLHTQRNALDSAFLFDTRVNYGVPGTPAPIRLLALGRDSSATIDSSYGAISGTGFQNDGDNEITGFHISDGDASTGGILGAKIPSLFSAGWRAFYTQQHGDNFTWELLPTP